MIADSAGSLSPEALSRLSKEYGYDFSEIDPTPVKEQHFPVTLLRRRPRDVYDFVDVYGNVAIITRRGKSEVVLTSLETYLLLTRFSTDEKTLATRAFTKELLRQREERNLLSAAKKKKRLSP